MGFNYRNILAVDKTIDRNIVAKIGTCHRLTLFGFGMVHVRRIDRAVAVRVAEQNSHRDADRGGSGSRGDSIQIHRDQLGVPNISEVDCDFAGRSGIRSGTRAADSACAR